MIYKPYRLFLNIEHPDRMWHPDVLVWYIFPIISNNTKFEDLERILVNCHFKLNIVKVNIYMIIQNSKNV